MPGLRKTSNHCSLSGLWDDVENSMKLHEVALTRRDRELFELLSLARWLSSKQVHHCLFGARSLNAVKKRLRKRVNAGFLARRRPDRTSKAYFLLGIGASSIVSTVGDIPRRLPNHLQHFRAINDVRLWFLRQHDEHALPLKRFAAEWEFRSVGRCWSFVPDGLAILEGVAGSSQLEVGDETL
jgi:hypothetical protein